MFESLLNEASVGTAFLCECAVMIERLAEMMVCEVIHEGIAGAKVKADEGFACDECSIADSADIAHCDGGADMEGGGEGFVIDGGEGSALPAMFEVILSELVDSWDSEPCCEILGIANLEASFVVRVMENGLAVKADNIGRGLALSDEHFSGAGMVTSDTPWEVLIELSGIFEGFEDSLACFVVIWCCESVFGS